MNDGLRLYLSNYKNGSPPVFGFCEYLNISVCPPTETNNVSLSSCGGEGDCSL